MRLDWPERRGADFVDFSLPSYEEASADGKKDSFFCPLRSKRVAHTAG